MTTDGLQEEPSRRYRSKNLLDLFLVIALILGVGGVYLTLSKPYQMEQTAQQASKPVWVQADIIIHKDFQWVLKYVNPGLVRKDPRTGNTVAEVVQVNTNGPDGLILVRMKLVVSQTPNGTLFYDNRSFIPGRYVQVETERCMIEGRVYALELLPAGVS